MSRALVAGAVLGAGVVSGGVFIQGGPGAHAAQNPGTPRLFEQVVAHVRANFIDSIPVDELYRKAAVGLPREIDDPYSMVLTPDAVRRLRESTTGRYAGVGLELDMRDGFVTVIAPISGTPADSAGIAPGDRIVAVNGTSTTGESMDEVQQLLRGPSGSAVRLSVQSGDQDSRTVTLRRTQIRYRPVQRVALPEPGVGYVELATFSDDAAGELRRVVDSLRRTGVHSLILDLRGNPGGLLEQGVAVADLFLDNGDVIVSTRGRTPEADQDLTDGAAEEWPRMPVVVLVDSGSASASEIVAGALQDHDRAEVIGSATYGKGSAQSVFTLAGGQALKLTTARWFTPEGRSIDRDSIAGGIMPDVLVQSAPAGNPDPVIAKALEILRRSR